MPRKRNTGDGGLYYIKSRKLWRATMVDKSGEEPRVIAKYGRTSQVAKDKLQIVRDEIKTFGAPLDRTATVSVWSDRWLTTVCRPTMKPAGLAAYESVTRTWIVPTIGTKTVANLKPSDVRAVVSKIIAAGKSSSTARKTYNVLSGMLDAARYEGLCARNVADDVKPPPMAVSNRGALTTDQALAVLREAASVPDGTRWWVALLGGLRQSERLGALISSLDLEAGEMHVDWTLEEITSEHGCGGICTYKRGASCPQARLKVPDGFEYIRLEGRLCLIRPKSGKPRTVPLVPQLVEALRRYITATKDVPNPYGLLWRHTDGSPILPYEDQEDWRTILELASVPLDRTSHWARHTTATVLMELGVDAKIVGEIVGHQSEKVTRHYQHVSSPAATEAMGRLGTHWSDALELPA